MRTLALIALVPVAACAPVERDEDTDPMLTEPAVRVTGEAQSCINRAFIRNTRVRSDRVIDFEMRGGEVYRNVLTSDCPRLGFERAFTYDTSINQLCNTEIIYVLEQIAGVPQRGAGCGLGQFVPVEYAGEE